MVSGAPDWWLRGQRIDYVELINTINLLKTINSIGKVDLIDTLNKIGTISKINPSDTENAVINRVDLIDVINLIKEITHITKIDEITKIVKIGPVKSTFSDSGWILVPNATWTTLLNVANAGLSMWLYLEATYEQTYFRIYLDGEPLYFAAEDNTLSPYMLKHVYGYPGLNSPIMYAKENPNPPSPLKPAYNILVTLPLEWTASLKVEAYQASGESKYCGATVIYKPL